MTVKLVAITKLIPIGTRPYIDEKDGITNFIAQCARVSNPTNENNTLTAPKLLKYLADNEHWSPFEMAHAVVQITTTRDIARQILRHRSFAFQEFSQRYAEVSEISKEKNTETRECRFQDKKNRQNSIPIDTINTTEQQQSVKDEWEKQQQRIQISTARAYQWALKNGIAKEVARVVLPEGLTPSRLYMSGSMRSFIHYIKVRTHPSTQKEHRLIALAIKKEFKDYYDFD
jgi:thymidylate synthase (FAD)